ncbi:MAG: N-acetyltransferase family protein [Acidimicrobiales bacterium]
MSRARSSSRRRGSPSRGALGVVVAERDGVVAGFASLSPYRPRAAYRTTVENSVYVDEAARGSGVRRALMDELIDVATRRGFHTIVAHIVGGHEASIGLHHACGFQVVGTGARSDASSAGGSTSWSCNACSLTIHPLVRDWSSGWSIRPLRSTSSSTWAGKDSEPS